MNNPAFEITPDALPLINSLISENTNAESFLTICSSGTGCGGPLLKLEMRAPLETDIIIEREGIVFHVRENIKERLNGAVIEKKSTFWGDKISVNNGSVCMG